MSASDLPSPAPPATPTQADILLVDDDPKTLLAMEAILGGGRAPRSSPRAPAARRCSSCSTHGLRGHPPRRADARPRRLRDGGAGPRARQEPPHADHLPDRVQPERSPDAARLLARRRRLPVQADRAGDPAQQGRRCSSSCSARPHEIRRQARLIRDAEQREAERRWPTRASAGKPTPARADGARARGRGRDDARRRPRSWRARSPIATRRRRRSCSRTRGSRSCRTRANRLLTGQRPHELLDELFTRLTGAPRSRLLRLSRARRRRRRRCTLRAMGGICAEIAERMRDVRARRGHGRARRPSTRRRIIVDDSSTPVDERADGARSARGRPPRSAFRCSPTSGSSAR